MRAATVQWVRSWPCRLTCPCADNTGVSYSCTEATTARQRPCVNRRGVAGAGENHWCLVRRTVAGTGGGPNGWRSASGQLADERMSGVLIPVRALERPAGARQRMRLR